MIFKIAKRVCFRDTDAGGVVYYSRYLDFCEEARLEFLLSLGIAQSTLLREQEVMFVVRNCNVKYLRPARLEDIVTITIENISIAIPTIKMTHNIYSQQQLRLVVCDIDLVAISAQGRPLRKLPDELFTKLASHSSNR
ncbi:MAG: acyl-CoA thioesterase [Rickettsiales bacterium]|jgi:tol-pal system-associated acyl-CoA thioesterase|nr:acyl-CoA thioesterase [Rickettsiales bacterium]